MAASKRGYAWGLEQNRLEEEAENGGPDSIYPPPLKVGGWVNVDPAIFRGDMDALRPPPGFEPPSGPAAKPEH